MLIRMQNKYLLKKDFFLVLIIAQTRTTFSPYLLPQVAVNSHKPMNVPLNEGYLINYLIFGVGRRI